MGSRTSVGISEGGHGNAHGRALAGLAMEVPDLRMDCSKKENRVLNAKLPIGRVIEKERVKVRKKEDALIRFNNS